MNPLPDSLFGQDYHPDYIFPFDAAHKLNSSIQPMLSWKSQLESRFEEPNGLPGESLVIDRKSTGPITLTWKAESAITVEYWARFSPQVDHKAFNLFYQSDRSIITTLSASSIHFLTIATKENNELVQDQWIIPLDKNDILSYGYYADGSWHHFVWKYDARSGRKEIWVDGKSTTEFQKSVPPAAKICGRPPGCGGYSGFGIERPGEEFIGSLKDLMLYNRFVPANVHLQHVEQGKTGTTYQFGPQSNSRNIPALAQTPKGIDPIEYPPGHPHPQMDMVDQLRSFPNPRFKPGHTMLPNVNWVRLLFLGGARIPGRAKQEVAAAASDIQEELGDRWNYSLTVEPTYTSTTAPEKYPDDPFILSAIQLANRRPDLPVTMLTFWGQVRPNDFGYEGKAPFVFRQDLPDQYYLRDSRGNFLHSSTSTNKLLSPAAPTNLFERDGQLGKHNIQKTLSLLTRPIQMVNENGEMPFSIIPAELLEQDPQVVRDKNRLGALTWEEYLAKAKARQRLAYLGPIQALPGLGNTYFTWYKNDGGLPQYHFQWKYIRTCMTPIKGQYYPTPNFYVRWPYNWKKGAGPWMAWDWIEASRQQEIMAGDRLFSPYVAAGWDADPEKNVRPTQWLGLLKCLNVAGAEFFYTCFFNIGSGEDITADPRNYIWQLAIPSYAQAVASYFEEFLRDGHLLEDESGIPVISQPVADPRILMVVRKLTNQEKYVVGLTLQPSSNIRGNIEEAVDVLVPLGKHEYQLSCRAQGSVYILDITDPDHPVITQPDAWHQKGHPLNWHHTQTFEAELCNTSGNLQTITEHTRENALFNDYTEFTTFLQSRSGKCSVTISPDSNQWTEARVRVRVRNTSGPASFRVMVNGQHFRTKNCVRNRNWAWVDLGNLSTNLSAPGLLLSIEWDDPNLQIDQIELAPGD